MACQSHLHYAFWRRVKIEEKLREHRVPASDPSHTPLGSSGRSEGLPTGTLSVGDRGELAGPEVLPGHQSAGEGQAGEPTGNPYERWKVLILLWSRNRSVTKTERATG